MDHIFTRKFIIEKYGFATKNEIPRSWEGDDESKFVNENDIFLRVLNQTEVFAGKPLPIGFLKIPELDNFII